MHLVVVHPVEHLASEVGVVEQKLQVSTEQCVLSSAKRRWASSSQRRVEALSHRLLIRPIIRFKTS